MWNCLKALQEKTPKRSQNTAREKKKFATKHLFITKISLNFEAKGKNYDENTKIIMPRLILQRD